MSLVSGQESANGKRLSIAFGLAWPFFMIVAFFGVPFVLLLRVSVARVDPAYYQGSGWSLEAMASLFQPMVLNGLTFSLWLALTVATLSMIIAFPTTYFISLTPSFYAVVSCLIYVVIPFNVMTIYPGLSRIDASYMEAASTMGATPVRAFFNVLLPLMRKPIATAYLTTVVMTIGAYVAPLVLGGPSNWTIGVIISEVANSAQNLPQASAIAILLMLVTGAMILVINRIGGKGYTS